MENTIQSDLIRGHINTIILKALFDGDRYGYDIVKEIEQKSSGQYKLKQPTLYSCLKRLELQGFIRSYWGAKSNGGRRKYFTLTDMGKELFLKNQTEWEYSRTVIDKLISDREVDLQTIDLLHDESGTNEVDMLEEFTEDEVESKEVDNKEILTPQNVQQENSVFEVVKTVPPSPPVKKEPQKFLDTAAIMNQLYENQMTSNSGESYLDKLVADKYVADKSVGSTSNSSGNYFQDFYNEDDEKPYTEMLENEAAELKLDKLIDYKLESEELHISQPKILEVFPEKEFNEKSNFALEQSAHSDESVNLWKTDESITNNVQDDEYSRPLKEENKNLMDGFHKYDESVTGNTGADIIEREYKNILGSFSETAFTTFNKPIKQKANTASVVIKNVASARDHSDAFIADRETAASTSTPIESYTNDADVNKKLSKLSGDMREMGDTLKIRTHNRETSKEFSNLFYYNSNKLMLVHYAILFAIMLVETLVCAMIVYFGAGLNPKNGVWLFVGAVLVAFIFPVVAFIKNYMAPNKRKRINFSLKSSMVYRNTIMVQCWLIIYCFNLAVFKMPVSFGMEYLATLLLPAVLCTNFPVSALIFSSLYKSKKYAVEE